MSSAQLSPASPSSRWYVGDSVARSKVIRAFKKPGVVAAKRLSSA